MQKMIRIKDEVVRGFTIVELIIVIVVVGILAAIAIVGYGNWQHSIRMNQVKSDLVSAQVAMKSALNTQGEYPGALPATFSASDGVLMSYAGGTTKSYCLNASSVVDPSIQFYMSSIDDSPNEGTCEDELGTWTAPDTPADAVAIPVSSTAIQVLWEGLAGVSTYRVQCAQDRAFIMGSVEKTAESDVTSVTLDVTANPSIYTCRVLAVNAFGKSTWRMARFLTELDVPSVTASGSGAASITLQWEPVLGAATYTVERDTVNTFNSSNLVSGTELQSNATIERISSGLAASQTYYYRVRAEGLGSVTSDWSNIAQGTTSNLAPPTGLVATSGTTTSIAWSFNAVDGANRYDIELVKGSTCATAVSVVSSATTNPTLSGLSTGSIYCARVRSVAPNNTPGSYSSYVQYSTTQPTVTGISASVTNLTATTVSWTAITNNSYYEYNKLDASCSTVVGTATQTATSRSVTGLTKGTTYCYRIRSVSPDGVVGAWSSTVTATTYTDVMNAGESITLSGSNRNILYSSGMGYRLALQTDANLVIYRNSDNAVQWYKGGSTTTANYKLAMQSDCNLVMYNGTTAVWSTGTSGYSSPCYLALQSDNKIVVYAGGAARWWSN